MKRYRKSIVALIGLAVIVAKELWGIEFGIDPAGAADTVISMVTAGGTLLGVYGFANEG